jgi:glucokinase
MLSGMALFNLHQKINKNSKKQKTKRKQNKIKQKKKT